MNNLMTPESLAWTETAAAAAMYHAVTMGLVVLVAVIALGATAAWAIEWAESNVPRFLKWINNGG